MSPLTGISSRRKWAMAAALLVFPALSGCPFTRRNFLSWPLAAGVTKPMGGPKSSYGSAQHQTGARLASCQRGSGRSTFQCRATVASHFPSSRGRRRNRLITR